MAQRMDRLIAAVDELPRRITRGYRDAILLTN